MEQAQRGELVFRSKLASPTLPPALVNLEWLVVGWLAALLGGRTLLAYRVFGLLALAGSSATADRWLVRCGLAARSAGPPALLLVFTGGGLGGLLWTRSACSPANVPSTCAPVPSRSSRRSPTPTSSPAATLLLGALAAFAAGRPALGAALGAVLAFVRPYDARAADRRRGRRGPAPRARHRDRLRRLLPLAAVAARGSPTRWWVFRARARASASSASPLYAADRVRTGRSSWPSPSGPAGPRVASIGLAARLARRGGAEPRAT